MKSWKIPVTWEVCSEITIEADTLEEAMEIARDDDGIIPCPAFPQYVDGSWRLSMDEIEYIRECYNNGESDNI